MSLMKPEGEWGEYYKSTCTLEEVYGCATIIFIKVLNARKVFDFMGISLEEKENYEAC